MSLLTMIQTVCDRIGLPRPLTVSDSTDQLARQMAALANAELRELSRKYTWPVLVRDYQVPVVAGVASYALPSDYYSMVSSTAYLASQYNAVRGSLSPQDWQRRKQTMLNGLDRLAFRIYGNPPMMIFDPVPDAANPPLYEYKTKSYARDVNGALKLMYTADTDESLIDEELVTMGLMWRIKHAKGLEFSADRAEYDMTVPREFSKALAAPDIPVGGLREDSPITDGYVRSTGFGV